MRPYIDVPLPKTNTKIRLLAIHTEKEDDDDEIHCSLFVCYIQDAEFVAL
jgi:ATP-dependent 26S proteasome regulatory subunit